MINNLILTFECYPRANCQRLTDLHVFSEILTLFTTHQSYRKTEMENTWLLLILGLTAFFASMTSHERIRQMQRNPFIINLSFGLKIERAAYAVFSFLFFAIWITA